MPGTGRFKKGRKTVAHVPGHATAKLDGVLVASGQKRQLRLASLGPKKLALIAFIVVLLAAGVGALYWGLREPPIAEGPKCSRHVLNKAYVALRPEKLAELEPVVNEIKAIPGYDQDPNCLYVVETYYINQSDPTGANETHAKLRQVFDPGVGYDSALVDAKTPDELQPTIDFLNEQAARYQNAGPMGAPSE